MSRRWAQIVYTFPEVCGARGGGDDRPLVIRPRGSRNKWVCRGSGEGMLVMCTIVITHPGHVRTGVQCQVAYDDVP